jgi:phosphatidylinositol-4,5-bisphosphate 3-kinase
MPPLIRTQTKLGFKRETAPFVFTKQFAQVLNGVGAPLYNQFVEYCLDGFCVMRKHARHLCVLLGMMMSFGIRELQDQNDILWVRDHLHLEVEEQEARVIFKKLIVESMNCDRTQFNNFCHILKHS